MALRWFEQLLYIDPPIDNLAPNVIQARSLPSVVHDGSALRRSILQYSFTSDNISLDLLPDNHMPWDYQVAWTWFPVEFGDDIIHEPFDNGGTAIWTEHVEWVPIIGDVGGIPTVTYESKKVGPTRQSKAQHKIPDRTAVVMSQMVGWNSSGLIPTGWTFLNVRGWMSWRFLVDMAP